MGVGGHQMSGRVASCDWREGRDRRHGLRSYGGKFDENGPLNSTGVKRPRITSYPAENAHVARGPGIMEGFDELIEGLTSGLNALPASVTSVWIPIQLAMIALAALIG